MIKQKIISFVVLLPCVFGSPPSYSKDPPLVELSRELQFHQAQSVVRGGDRSQIHKTLAQMSNVIQDTPFSEGISREASQAIVLYILGGGNPYLVERKLSVDGQIIQQPVVAGVLQYSMGDKESAKKYLGNIDPLTLPASIGGHIALVQAMLSDDKDAAIKLHKLALARLLLPGSIAEEVALRESAEASFASRRFDDLVFSVDQYFRRFPTSVYATSFSQRLRLFIQDAVKTDMGEIHRRLIDIFMRYNPHASTKDMLLVCKALILNGRFTVATSVSTQIMDRKISDPERIQAVLYLVAALPLTSDAEGHLQSLRKVPLEKLATDDQSLLKSVLSVRDGIGGMPREQEVASERPASEQNENDEFILQVTRQLSEVR